MCLASPYLIFIFLILIFSLGRLSSDELSLDLNVLLGRKGPPCQMRRRLFFSIMYLILCLLIFDILGVPLGGRCLMMSYFFLRCLFEHDFAMISERDLVSLLMICWYAFRLCTQLAKPSNTIILKLNYMFPHIGKKDLMMSIIFFATSFGIDLLMSFGIDLGSWYPFGLKFYVVSQCLFVFYDFRNLILSILTKHEPRK